jgi:tetratricopeptide (TPR) repeat protein
MKNSSNELFFTALIRRADVYSFMGEHKNAYDDYRLARKCASDGREIITSNLGLAELFLKEGEPGKSTKLLRKLLLYARKKRYRDTKGSILNVMCNAKIMESRTKEAERYAREALHFFVNIEGNSMERNKGIAESLNNLGGILSSKGHLKQAMKCYQKSYRVRNKMGDREGMAITLNNIGVTYMDLREYSKALSYLRKSLEMRRNMGYVHGIGICSGNMAIVYWKQGKHEEALRFLEENLKNQLRIGDKAGAATSMNNIGVIHRIQGEYEKALEFHQRSYQLRKKIGDRFGMTINLNQMGNIFLNRGEYELAQQKSNMEGELCRKMGNEPRMMNYYGLRARILSERGKPAMAYDYMERSLEINQRLKLKIDEARDLTAMAHIVIMANLSGKEFGVPLSDARRFLSRSMRIVKESKHRFEYCVVISRLAMLNVLKKQYTRAIEQISEAEQIAAKHHFFEFMPEVLFLKASILTMKKKGKVARRCLNKSMHMCKAMGLKPLMRKIDELKMAMGENEE